jgi:hypothetical protein
MHTKIPTRAEQTPASWDTGGAPDDWAVFPQSIGGPS